MQINSYFPPTISNQNSQFWFIVMYIWMYYVGIVAQTDVTIAFIFFNKVGENNAGH